METPEGNRDHKQVQRHPKRHIQTTRGRESCRQVLRGVTNHLQAQKSVGRNREPTHKLWQWNRIYPTDDFSPRKSNLTGNEEILEWLPRMLQLKIILGCTWNDE